MMEERKYPLSFFGEYPLVCVGDDKVYYTIKMDSDYVMVECKKSDNSMKVLKRTRLYDECIAMYESQIKKNVIHVISEDGSRWEGDLLNNQPYGFGNVYDGEGSRIYSGFMFKGRKIGFGIEYFADTHTVDYCGTFWNNKRHGRGSTYDRNGKHLYEGDWSFGLNDCEKESIVIDDFSEKDFTLCLFVKELIINNYCFNNWQGDLTISNYPYLEKIVIKKNSLKSVSSLKIANNENLKTIETEDDAFYDVKTVVIESN